MTTRETGSLTADLHLSSLSSKFKFPVSSLALPAAASPSSLLCLQSYCFIAGPDSASEAWHTSK